MYQNYVLELQQYADGTYGHIMHYVWDEDETTARLKGEGKYYEVQSAAATSNIPGHGAILLTSQGDTLMRYYYEKAKPEGQTVAQYYVVEFQQYENGEYGHTVFPVFDVNPDMARRKGDSKLYEVLSAAAISNLPEHAAALIAYDTSPLGNQSYRKIEIS